MSVVRSIARGVAHRKMKKDGVVRPNKKDKQTDAYGREFKTSYFASHWREYV